MYSSETRTILKGMVICFAALFFLCTGAASVAAGGEAAAGRAIMDKWHDAVVPVKVITKLRFIVEGRETYKSEDESETIATVIDPSGLAVLSFSTIDPARIYSEFFKKMKPDQEGMPKFNIESDIGSVKIVLSDGQELSAKIVMRDNGLDLAFIMPAEKASKPFPALDLSREVKLDVLDTVVILTRLGKVASRAPSISLHHIEAAVKKPKGFYVSDQNALIGKLGAPVFSLDGRVAGISVVRISKTEEKSLGMANVLGGMSAFGMMPVILPSEEILRVAKQALALKDK